MPMSRFCTSLLLFATLTAVVGVVGLPGCVAAAKSRYSQVPGDGLPPRVPNPWFFLERAFPLGEIPREQWRLAQTQAAALKAIESPFADT